jgi:dTDP-4-dehydrorhamnose reductase
VRLNDRLRPVLLFGAGGQLGRALRAGLAPVCRLIAYTRNAHDITDAARVRGTIRDLRPALIVNAAAYTAVDRAESDLASAFAVNASAVQAIASAAREAGAALIHFSTDYVFDGHADQPYTELSTPNPLSVYGRSKRAGERAICIEGADAMILRTSWLFSGSGQNFVRTILRLAQMRDTLRVVSDQVGQPTPVSLLADVTVRLARRVLEGRTVLSGAELFHVAARGAISWHGFARAIVAQAARAGCPLRLSPAGITAIETSAYPLPAARPKNSRLDLTRIEAALGMEMPGWQPGLSAAVEEIMALEPA